MDEVEIGTVRNSAEEGGSAVFRVHVVPAHVRNLESARGKVGGESADDAGDEAEARRVAFLGMLEDDLGTEADAEHGLARMRPIAEKGVEARFLELVHRELRLADPGEYDSFGPGEVAGVLRNPVLGADRREGALDAFDVACVVIDDSCHNAYDSTGGGNSRSSGPAFLPILEDSMTLKELIALLASVLTTPEVIGVTIAIAIYVNIVVYIVRYRKRVPRPKAKRVRQAPAPAEESSGGEEGAEAEEASPVPEKKASRKGAKGAKEAPAEEEAAE